MKANVTVVILAAGLGTRMKSKKAKVLHEAGGDTLLNQVIRAALHVAHADNILAVVGYQAEAVRKSVEVKGVRFALQNEQLGTGHAVMCAESEIGSRQGKLLILNGDGPLLRAETLVALLERDGTPNWGGTLLTTRVPDPTGYGRIVRDEGGMIAAIVEQKSATAEQRAIDEINPGVYCFDAEPFWRHLYEVTPNAITREYYLTDIVEILRRHGYRIAPLLVADETELLGINTRVELSVADRILRARKTEELMLSGVTIENPGSVTVDVNVEVEADTTIEANVQLRGHTRIGRECRIGTGSVLRDCVVGDNVSILPYVIGEDSRIDRQAAVGPFARLRMEAEVGEDTRIGNFVELKKTRLGAGSKAQHLAYLGDASIGTGVNIGAGTITCNYDGRLKHRTDIADEVFIGSNSTLVAPLNIEEGSYIGAGSVITKNVSADSLALGRAHQVEKEGWAKRRRVAARQPSGQPSEDKTVVG
jgi:bifunctional UDP-N-acetylglucosamine pyrophosphorylase/glucosamine-1-phosphate N-acetyltransferase